MLAALGGGRVPPPAYGKLGTAWKEADNISHFRAEALEEAARELDSKIDKRCRELAANLLDGK
jgi:hypothetical protein